MVAVMGELGSRVWSAAARPPIKWGSAQLPRVFLYRSDLLRVRASASKRFGAGCDLERLRLAVDSWEGWLKVSRRTKERRCGGGVTRASASMEEDARRVYGGGIEVVVCWEMSPALPVSGCCRNRRDW
jgi:hypothetical protein